MCMCTTFMQCPWRAEEDIRCSRTEATEGCELPCGCWDCSPNLLQQQQQALLAPDLSLHPSLCLLHNGSINVWCNTWQDSLLVIWNTWEINDWFRLWGLGCVWGMQYLFIEYWSSLLDQVDHNMFCYLWVFIPRAKKIMSRLIWFGESNLKYNYVLDAIYRTAT